MVKSSLLVPFLVLVFVTSLLAGGCGSATTQAPETTALVTTSAGAPGELDIDSALLRHVISTATTEHGKLVLAKLLIKWSHGYGHGPFQHNEDGSWLATLSIDESVVAGNELLEPIFKDPVDKKYTVEWTVNADGTVFTPRNDNAVRLEAELGK